MDRFPEGRFAPDAASVSLPLHRLYRRPGSVATWRAALDLAESLHAFGQPRDAKACPHPAIPGCYVVEDAALLRAAIILRWDTIRCRVVETPERSTPSGANRGALLPPSAGRIGDYPLLSDNEMIELLDCLSALKPMLVSWLMGLGYDGVVAEQAVEDATWVARAWVLTGRVVTLGRRRRRWLMVVSRNAAIDIVRCKSPTRPVRHVEPRPPSRLAERAEETGRALRDAVGRAIRRLPERERDALLACEVEGMTYREAAEMFAAHTSTVNNTLARARRRLYDAVVEEARAEGYDPSELPAFSH